MTKKEKIRAIFSIVIKYGVTNDSLKETCIKFDEQIVPPLYMTLQEWSNDNNSVVNKQYRILGVSVTNNEDGIDCWANYYDNVEEKEDGYDIEYLSDEEIDNIYMVINAMNETDDNKLKDLLDDCRKTLESTRAMGKEYEAMKEAMDYVLEQWKSNKRWFREEPGKVTTEDVIKRVFQYAWNKRREFKNSL